MNHELHAAHNRPSSFGLSTAAWPTPFRGGALLRLVLFVLLALLCLAPAALATPGDLFEAQREAARVRAQVEELDRRASIAVERYNTARAELDAITARLSTARRTLDRTQTQLDVAHTVYDRRMADMYKSGGISVLDILVSTESFAELETHVDYFLQINEADTDSIEELQRLSAQVEKLTAQLDSDRSTLLKGGGAPRRAHRRGGPPRRAQGGARRPRRPR